MFICFDRYHFSSPVALSLGSSILGSPEGAIPSLSSVSRLECEACQLDKHHHSTFSSSTHDRESESFNLVHTDI